MRNPNRFIGLTAASVILSLAGCGAPDSVIPTVTRNELGECTADFNGRKQTSIPAVTAPEQPGPSGLDPAILAELQAKDPEHYHYYDRERNEKVIGLYTIACTSTSTTNESGAQTVTKSYITNIGLRLAEANGMMIDDGGGPNIPFPI